MVRGQTPIILIVPITQLWGTPKDFDVTQTNKLNWPSKLVFVHIFCVNKQTNNCLFYFCVHLYSPKPNLVPLPAGKFSPIDDSEQATTA